MRHFKFLTLVLLFLTISCSTDDDQIMEDTNPTIEPARRAINSKQSGTVINTDNRAIIAQLFSGPNFTGQVYTVAAPMDWRSSIVRIEGITFDVKSAAFAKNLGMRTKFRNIVDADKVNPRYFSVVEWDKNLLNDAYVQFTHRNDLHDLTTTYAGQLFSANRTSQIPIWDSVSFNHPSLAVPFHKGAGAFIPASRTLRGLVAFRESDHPNSNMLALIPTFGRNITPNTNTLHSVVSSKARYLFVDDRIHSGIEHLIDHRIEDLINKALHTIEGHVSNFFKSIFNSTSPLFSSPDEAYAYAITQMPHFASNATVFEGTNRSEETDTSKKTILLNKLDQKALRETLDKYKEMTGRNNLRWADFRIRINPNTNSASIWEAGTNQGPFFWKGSLSPSDEFERRVFRIFFWEPNHIAIYLPDDTIDFGKGTQTPDYMFNCQFAEVKDISNADNPFNSIGRIEGALKQIHTRWGTRPDGSKLKYGKRSEIFYKINDQIINNTEWRKELKNRLQESLDSFDCFPSGHELKLLGVDGQGTIVHNTLLTKS